MQGATGGIRRGDRVWVWVGRGAVVGQQGDGVQVTAGLHDDAMTASDIVQAVGWAGKRAAGGGGDRGNGVWGMG